ncbi:type II secretion system protein, partial [Staphylococcus condimenti]
MKRFVLLIKKLKKDIAYKNNRFNAFTLIEMLFSFSIFCIVLSLIPPLFQTVTVLNKQVNDTSLINFEFFAQDITRELNDIPIKNITVENNHLVVKHEDELTNYT